MQRRHSSMSAAQPSQLAAKSRLWRAIAKTITYRITAAIADFTTIDVVGSVADAKILAAPGFFLEAVRVFRLTRKPGNILLVTHR